MEWKKLSVIFNASEKHWPIKTLGLGKKNNFFKTDNSKVIYFFFYYELKWEVEAFFYILLDEL